VSEKDESTEINDELPEHLKARISEELKYLREKYGHPRPLRADALEAEDNETNGLDDDD
jgi:hypothetical protein